MEKTKLLILRLTERCNLACAYCYAASGVGGEDMRPSIAEKAVRLLAKRGERLNIQLTGGEPLLCAGLIREIYEYTRREGIRAAFSIQTNGTLLSAESCALLRELRCAVGVSLDGIGAANGLRVYPDGANALDRTVAGIKMLAAAGMKCNINAVVTSKNQRVLYQLVELAAYLGNVGGIGLDMFRPLGRGGEQDCAPDEKTLDRDLARMLEKRGELSRLGVNIRIKELEKTRFALRTGFAESRYCYAQTGLSAAVDYKGDMYPCSSLAGLPEMRIGNVDTGIRALPPRALKADAGCADCAEFSLCRGGCPAGRFANGGVSRCDCIMHRTFIEYGRKENV